MREHCVIDPKAIENLRALDNGSEDEFLREVAGIFFEDTPRRLGELEESLRAGDVGRFTRAAHSIKGSSANLGAVALRASAEKLEHHARMQGLVGAPPLVADVKLQFERTRAELTALLGA